MSLAERIKQYLAEDIEEASMGAPDYNPAAGKYASNMDYGMFTDGGNEEVEEIVVAACDLVKDGKMDSRKAVDAAMQMLTMLADDTPHDEAEDTDVRERVAREIMSRCDEVEESIMDEAVGDAASPLYDLIDEVGSHQLVLDELVRFLDVDQIEEFVADFRRHHDMNEADVEENAFNQAAAAAARAHKDEFEFNGKKYKTKMSKATAHELNDSVSNEDLAALRRLAGI